MNQMWPVVKLNNKIICTLKAPDRAKLQFNIKKIR